MAAYVIATGDEVAPTNRSYWVVPGLFAAGSYPGREDPDAPDRKLGPLIDAGIGAFVNLTFDNDPHSSDGHLNEYDEEAERLLPSVQIVRLPIVDMSAPRREHMVAILDRIDGFLGEGVGTYVHCWGGLGRTGTVVGCWLVRHGIATPETVLPTLDRMRRQDRIAGWQRAPQTRAQDRLVTGWARGE